MSYLILKTEKDTTLAASSVVAATWKKSSHLKQTQYSTAVSANTICARNVLRKHLKNNVILSKEIILNQSSTSQNKKSRQRKQKNQIGVNRILMKMRGVGFKEDHWIEEELGRGQ